jgi:hypothetical protein
MNETIINLTNLSIQEVNFILGAIQELPAKIANPLSQKIREQAVSQLPKQEPEAE